MKPRLYDYWRSSASYRVRIALNLAGLDYDTVSVDLLQDAHQADSFKSLNPQGLVPALAIDGKVFTQSLAIIEYLDETRKLGLIPADHHERWRVRTLSYCVAMEIHPVCNVSVAKFANEASKNAIGVQQWMQTFIPKGLKAVERFLNQPETGRYCHGDTVTMADLCLAPQVYNANRWSVTLNDFPMIERICSRLVAIDEFAKAHPDQVNERTE